MANTRRTKAELLTIFADGQNAADITEQDLRDLIVSMGMIGFFDYNDLTTQTTPIVVTGGGGFVDLTNDEAGPNTNKNYPPNGITNVWDVANQRFDFAELTLGSRMAFRLDIEITTTAVNQTIDTEIQLAIGGTTYTLAVTHEQYKAVGVYQVVKSSFVYMGDDNTRNNYGKFRIKSDGNMTVKVNGWACYIDLY